MKTQQSKKVLLFSTLNPFPFWAGSENFWFDFVADERVNMAFRFHLILADSPVTRKKVSILEATGTEVDFYKHFNVSFTRRNLFRFRDRLNKRDYRTLPWFDQIRKGDYDLVWFNVSALGDLQDLYYPVQLCKEKKIPYWLILQHGYEDFFLTSEKEAERVTEVATSAKSFIFIAERNRRSLERAIGQELKNAFHSVNALPKKRIEEASVISRTNSPGTGYTARFFNLGRFSPKDKAQHLLLEAFAEDKWKSRDWRLSFIGVDGFGKIYLENMMLYYGTDSDKIEILNHTDRVFGEIAKQDVLLMPSLSEGTPFAMVESMACGRPAFGTPIGGIPELIIENKTGWLARTTNSRDIKEKLEEVWQQRGEWQQFGKQAQEHIRKNYNQDKSFEELLQLLINDTHS